MVNGAPLIIEDLDLSGLGLYLESQVDQNNLDDYELTGYLSLGRPLWQRKSDLGTKRFVYDMSELKKWPGIK